MGKVSSMGISVDSPAGREKWCRRGVNFQPSGWMNRNVPVIVFGQGLAFDRVAGRFDVDDGVAQTDDLRIDAPAAEIRMRGRTDLRERTYDQTMTVRPGVGSALPIIGAVAGGAAGAAAGAALQLIFAEPLKGISEVRYAVDGSWESPRIRPIAVEPAESAGG